MLVDDNAATNFIHKKFLAKNACTEQVVDFQVGQEALNYLSDTSNSFPELILVDINMPTMDAWEFLNQYKRLRHPDKTKAKIILLTTSLSPEDKERIANFPLVQEIKLKPLNTATIQEIMSTHFDR
ncbi:Two-component system-response regulator, receiver domain [Croceitalea dokdonensis DOKDO 023]|uniref:Two-component system-response regulator, receiver domain n=2 Tax=Croceitalea TaxID=574891 RepID=A0A0P7AFN7_9FLAO|nr:Two-component system-response regulator, receiver domain [Croceitalea dokdonensis DOKDO 023]